MTKTEANKVARAMVRADYNHVSLCQDWKTKDWYVVGLNRAWMKRTIEDFTDYERQI